jgi:hypothetical protein
MSIASVQLLIHKQDVRKLFLCLSTSNDYVKKVWRKDSRLPRIWRFKSFGMGRYVAVWVDPSVLNELQSLKTVGNTHTAFHARRCEPSAALLSELKPCSLELGTVGFKLWLAVGIFLQHVHLVVCRRLSTSHQCSHTLCSPFSSLRA